MTIRNVPADTRDVLAARAALAGKSLQEYLLNELVMLADKPSPDEVIVRARERVRLTGSHVPAALILAARDEDRR